MTANPQPLTPGQFQRQIRIPSAHGPRRFRDVMVKFQRDRFRQINPSLVAVAAGERPPVGRFFWEATKGASKDSDLAVCLLWLLAFTERPLTVQVGANDRRQADELRMAARDIIFENPWLGDWVKINKWQVRGANGSECEIATADKTGSHGARPDVLIINELSHVEDKNREFIETLRDNATKIPRGLVVVATNAGFVDTWQWKWRELARTSPRWCFNKVAEVSPWLDEEEIEEARLRNSNTRFLRLWKGHWASGGGDALDYEDIKACTTLTGPLMRWDERFGPYLGCLDIGLRHDHTALLVLGLDVPNRKVRLVNCKSWAPADFGGQTKLDFIKRTARKWVDRYDLEGILFDPNEAELLAEQLADDGVTMYRWKSHSQYQNRMAKVLLEATRNRQVELYPNEALIRDLQSLSIEDRAVGYKLTAPKDEYGHADRGIALAMGLPVMMDWLEDLVDQAGDEEAAEPEPERVCA